MPRTNLAVRVAGSVFGIAGEMPRLPAYFDNPDCVEATAYCDTPLEKGCG